MINIGTGIGADTSPLNYLIRLGHPEVLPGIYGRVLVPPAVLIELHHPDAPSEVRAWASAPPAWLEKRQVQQIDGSLAAELGAGEREAISLALEAKADILLLMNGQAAARRKRGILKYQARWPFFYRHQCADISPFQKH